MTRDRLELLTYFRFQTGSTLRVIRRSIVFACLFVISLVQAHAAPSISSISPTLAPIRGLLVINGSGFGATQGSSTVKINGVVVAPGYIGLWSGTRIGLTLPAGTTTGNVIVTVSGVSSNSVFSSGKLQLLTALTGTGGLETIVGDGKAEITGGLEHPGIVPVYGAGTHGDGRPFYAMRFIRGDSLKDAIAQFHGRSREPSGTWGREVPLGSRDLPVVRPSSRTRPR